MPRHTNERATLVLCLTTLFGCDLDRPADTPPDARAVTDTDASVTDSGTFSWSAWGLPEHFPEPPVPGDNPMSDAKVELGRHLFYDPRLSLNETQSCSSCHLQELAFTDGLAHAVGSTGLEHPRSAMSLANVGFASSLTWAQPRLTTLEGQSLVPLFGTEPVELGFRYQEETLFERFRSDERYPALFRAAFPDFDRYRMGQVTDALAAFERVLISGGSAYDAYLAGDEEALSEEARRGERLFHSERLGCFHCHSGFNLSDAVRTAEASDAGQNTPPFHNTGLYNLDDEGAYPEESRGLITITGNPDDMGKFKVPTLRNVALTAPYMHDGSVETLDEVIDHYAAGGRTIESGPYRGVGADNPLKDVAVTGFEISASERRALLAFLNALTDEVFIENPRLSNPWESQE